MIENEFDGGSQAYPNEGGSLVQLVLATCRERGVVRALGIRGLGFRDELCVS